MNRPKIRKLKVAHGSELYSACIELRDEFLRKPLGLNFSKEELEKEVDQLHLALVSDGRIVGCLALLPISDRVIKMRQVIIHPDYQAQGMGKELVEFSEEVARKGGWKFMELHARVTAVPFYLRLGYEITGFPFTEVKIPHRRMYKELI